MKKISGYQCENCTTLFKTELEAVSCEERHDARLKEAKITGMKFATQDGRWSVALEHVKQVPESVMIKFSDMHGDFGRYVLEHYGYRGV